MTLVSETFEAIAGIVDQIIEISMLHAILVLCDAWRRRGFAEDPQKTTTEHRNSLAERIGTVNMCGRDMRQKLAGDQSLHGMGWRSRQTLLGPSVFNCTRLSSVT
jgi:hypothetical protein